MSVFKIFKKLATFSVQGTTSLKCDGPKFFIFYPLIFTYVAEISDGRHQQPVWGPVGPPRARKHVSNHISWTTTGIIQRGLVFLQMNDNPLVRKRCTICTDFAFRCYFVT
jgi:hypothetical protein